VTVSGRRFFELDSMRGIAALVVLFFHFKITFYKEAFTTGWQGFLLRPFVAGHESVMFFFVLSGFVLALPRLAGKSQPYSIFLLRRVLRIYGPYLVALALAVAGCAIWHGQLGPKEWPKALSLGSVLQNVLFIGNYDHNRYNMAFWSLVYEMRISLIFPLVFLLTIRLPKAVLALVILMLVFVGSLPGGKLTDLVGIQTTVTLSYIAVFMLGIVMAQNIHRIIEWFKELARWKKVCVLVLSFLLYTEGYQLLATPLWHLGELPIAVGAVGLIVSGLGFEAASEFLRSSLPAFLGRISYSLYLTHGTVLFSLRGLLKDLVTPPEFFVLYLPIALLLAWGFCVGVEEPFMRWSHAVKAKRTNAAYEEVPA
jgi:peptidoglycan/LPS O-acetylase OafA/YrhL